MRITMASIENSIAGRRSKFTYNSLQQLDMQVMIMAGPAFPLTLRSRLSLLVRNRRRREGERGEGGRGERIGVRADQGTLDWARTEGRLFL